MTYNAFAIAVPIGAYHPQLYVCLKSLSIQEPKPAVAIMDASGDERVGQAVAAFPGLAAYHRTGPDKGQSDAIIEGWEHVEGEILGWLNADDALYPGAIEKAARQFRDNPETDVFYGHTTIIDNYETTKGYHWAVEPPSEALLYGDIISQPSCFFRRSKVDDIGGLDRNLHYTMDWDLWVRLWRAGAKFSYTEDVLSRVLWSSDAKTGGFNKQRQQELERIIGANAGLARRAKSRVGFALHHLFEYVAPPRFADAVRGLPFRQMRSINGLDRLGRFRGEANLPLVHYQPRNARGLAVEIEARGLVSLSANGAYVEAEGAGVHELIFDAPAGKTVELRLENKTDRWARLLGARWLS